MFPLNTVIAWYKTYYEHSRYDNKTPFIICLQGISPSVSHLHQSTNNLVCIWQRSYTLSTTLLRCGHLVMIMLSSWKRFCQWVCNIQIRMYLANHLRLYATLISYELIWHCISLVFLVRPQSLSLKYVANIAVEYSFIVLRHSEMHQAPHKELLTQTPSKGLLSK